MHRILVAGAFALLAAPVLAQQGQPGAHFVENWDLDGDGSVTVAEATERRGDVFLSFDADENGFLDAEEYALFDQARALDMEGQGGHGKGVMERAATGMTMAVNDTNADGRVSRDEFTGNAAAWIASMDSDGDGRVTTDDFGRIRAQGMGASKG